MIVYKNDFGIPASGSSVFPTTNFSLIDFLIATWTKITALDTWTTTGGSLVQTAAANNNYIVANTGDIDQRVSFDLDVLSRDWNSTLVLSTNVGVTVGVAIKLTPTRLSMFDKATSSEIAVLEITNSDDQLYSTTLNVVAYRHGQSVYLSVYDTVRQKFHILTSERARSPLTFSTYVALRGQLTYVAPVKFKFSLTEAPNTVPCDGRVSIDGIIVGDTWTANDENGKIDYYTALYLEILGLGSSCPFTCAYVNSAPGHAYEGVIIEYKTAGDQPAVFFPGSDPITGWVMTTIALPVYESPDLSVGTLQLETLHSRVDVTDAMMNLTALRARVQEEVQDGGVTTASIDAYLNRAYSEIYFSEHWRERKFTADIILHAGVEEYGLPVAIGDIGSIRRYNGMLRYDGEKALEQIYSQGLADGTPENVTMNGRTVKFSPTPSLDWEGSLLRCEYYAGLTRVTTTGMIEPGGLSSATDYPNLHQALHECVAQLAAIKLMATLREDGIAPASKRADYARAYAFAKDQALGKDLSPAQVRIYRR